MIPADLGRLFRPYGAEHMHAQPTTRAQPDEHRYSNLPFFFPPSFDSCSLDKKSIRSVGRCRRFGCAFCAPAGPCRVIPAEEPCSGPDGPPAAPSASQPRGESPSAPPEGREGGSSVFRRVLTCEEDSEGEPTAKQVVSQRRIINCLGPAENQREGRASPVWHYNDGAE